MLPNGAVLKEVTNKMRKRQLAYDLSTIKEGLLQRRYAVAQLFEALQAGRSPVPFLMMSLEFFIDIILPAALWPWG